MHDGEALVTARSGATFELRPATAAEASAFQAPRAAWRIVSRETTVLPSAGHSGSISA